VSRPGQTELERLRFWQGQILRSRDFRDQTSIEAQMRHWHNRALHNAYGVALGLEATAVGPMNAPTAVRVSCGLAYDCFGRELILPRTTQIAIPDPPDVSGRHWGQTEIGLVLAVHYRERASACCSAPDEISAVCWPVGCVGQPDELEFFWAPIDVRGTLAGVPVARIIYDQGLPKLDKDFVAPRARALTRPFTAHGMTIPGNTPWTNWEVVGLVIGRGIFQYPVGVQVRIDTSAAGFTETPEYFAWLEGRSTNGPLTAFSSITETSIEGFTFRLLDLPIIRHRLRLDPADVSTETKSSSRKYPAESTEVLVQLANDHGLIPGEEVALFINARDFVPAIVDAIPEADPIRMISGPLPAQPVEIASYYSPRAGTDFLARIQKEKLYVCWTGIQEKRKPQEKCPQSVAVKTLCD
jgi:hypothetical protein